MAVNIKDGTNSGRARQPSDLIRRKGFDVDSHVLGSDEEPVFVSKEKWNAARVHALAIYCSDGRWGDAFDEFCQSMLDIPRYDRFAVPGGAAWLSLRDLSLLHCHDAAHENIDLLIRIHKIKHVVLIAHFGCAFYELLLGGDPETFIPAQKEDMRTGAWMLRNRFPGIRVQSFLARESEGHIKFYEIEV